MPGHVPIWANFVVYGPILKISNGMCISNGNLEFSPQMTRANMHAWAIGHVPIWANFVVYGSILKISNSMCISNGNLVFSDIVWLSSALLRLS